MTNFELFALVTGYTLAITVLGWSAIGLFVALPIWWFVSEFFPDKPKSESERLITAVESIQDNFSDAFIKATELIELEKRNPNMPVFPDKESEGV
ncbi:hypothetical protein [Leptospira santarosai]|uniref:hypothetical protein n=1 Tax=Leptospira santarosai TaxID=28183 RepID=UPI000517ED22|nr:hypothetical protein [Leptospira santarosai]